MAEIKWSAAAIQTVLSTELNALANGSTSALSTAAYDNATELNIFADFQIDVTFGSAPTVNLPIIIYIVAAMDGTNYGASGYAGHTRGGWQVAASTSQQVMVIQGLPLPPAKVKFQVGNLTNQPFPATGTTVKMIPYRYAVS